MTKATWLSIVQVLLGAVGGFLLNKNLFGIEITSDVLSTGGGILLGVISIVWGFFDHTATLEQFQAAIRNTLSFVGTFLLAKGVNQDTITAVVGAVTALLPILYGILSRKKTDELNKGQINSMSLKK